MKLSKWVAYRERAERARGLGLAEFVHGLETAQIPRRNAAALFRQTYYEAILAEHVRLEPAIARFDGQLHQRLAREFAELDLQRIAAARLEVVRAEDGARLMHEMTGAVVETYDEMDRKLPDYWRKGAGDDFMLFDFVNPSVGEKFIEVEGIMDKSGRSF